MTIRFRKSLFLATVATTGALFQGCQAPASELSSLDAAGSQALTSQATKAQSTTEMQRILAPESVQTESVSLESCLPSAEDATTDNQLYTVLNEQELAEYEIPGNYVFRASDLPEKAITFDEQAMLNVVRATRDYFTEHGCQDAKILTSGLPGTQNIQISDVLNTLAFIAEVLQEDIEAGVPTRLKDPAFIEQNFEAVRWLGYDPAVPSEERLRITKYAVFSHPGSQRRTEIFNTPVYKLKDNFEDDSFITNYTKQEVLSGIFEPGGPEFGKVEVLAYLSRESFEDALMQGTAFITFPDGASTYFNVDRNNGIAFDSDIHPWDQGRYWYFKEVQQLNGYGHNTAAKIPIEPGVTFAGDVLNIGLGKIVAIEETDQTMRLGVIADTGGAFLPNLQQLDFFAGVFQTRDAYQQAISGMPEYTNAYLLIKKRVD